MEASARSGEPLDTSSPGHQTLRVFTMDEAGEEAHLEVDYQVICVIEIVLPSGFFLDRLISPEEQVMAGLPSLKARYVQGESILIAFRLRDARSRPGSWRRPNVLLPPVHPEFGEKHTSWSWLMIPFDAEAGFYGLLYDKSERLRIEIVPKP